MSFFCCNFAAQNENDMKKYLVICLFAVVAIGMTGCRNESVCYFNKKTVDLQVPQNKWAFDASANMFYCHFDVPELTAKVYDYGEVSVNREYNSGTNKAYQVALPETSYKVEEVDNGDGTYSTFYYAQHIDYAYGVGFVEVFYTISDYFYGDDFTPEAMLFRLQLTY